MTDGWTTTKVNEVKVGDEVRIASGEVILVSRIEANFMGMPTMVAFIEDTPVRWLKCPQQVEGQIDVRAPHP